jgi:hypothetical protein
VKITAIEHGLELAKPTEGYARTPGLHMSDIYGDLFKLLDPKRYDKRDAKGNPLPWNMLYLETGTAFEEIIEAAIAKRLRGERPGEFRTQDGTNVIYSPDHFIFDGDIFRLGEFKLTWLSNTGITDPKFDKWFVQMKAYCHHLMTPYARLYTQFVNGNYKPPVPELCAWDIEFSNRELIDNWNMLKRHGQRKGLIAA